ncbi:helix-turn-helix domain-containing protein [Paenibacillus sp. MMO-177]|uniref:helix-turn-helix domain-containing protein n=1 Tax=Paenibacillus sp. MMO-177 TaxID=3081289 RepID=UPI003018AE4C
MTEAKITSKHRPPVSVPIELLEDQNLSSSEKLVYIALYSFVNAHTLQAFPSVSKIAQLASVSERTVQRVMTTLAEKGYLTREAQYRYDPKNKTARQTSNLYSLDIPEKKDVPGDTMSPLPGDTMSPPPVTPCHPPGDTMSPQELKDFNSLTDSIINNDISRKRSIEFVFDQFKTEITKERFEKVVQRVSSYKTNDFTACLHTAVQNEISNMQVAVATADEKRASRSESKPKRTYSRKPKLALAGEGKEEPTGTDIDPDKLEKMRALARKLDGKE